EYRTAFQQSLFRVVQQVIRPRHCVSQRLVSFESSPSADQELESVIKAVAHFGRGHRFHPRSGKLDRQRYSVETTTNLRSRRRLVSRQSPSALCEQLHGGSKPRILPGGSGCGLNACAVPIPRPSPASATLPESSARRWFSSLCEWCSWLSLGVKVSRGPGCASASGAGLGGSLAARRIARKPDLARVL